MSTLLVQSCSKSKIQASEPVPAAELYSGYYYKIINKAMREDAFRSDIDLCIISAKYGVLRPNDEIMTYDWKMDRERANELQEKTKSDLREIILDEEYDTVVLNLGKAYRYAVAEFDTDLEVRTNWITGTLGERGRQLKQLIRTDCTNERNQA